MKAVVFAYHDMGYQGVQALPDAGYEIATIFTHTDDPGEKAFFGSVFRFAASAGIPVYALDEVNHLLWAERTSQLASDAILSSYYRHLLSDEILGLASKSVFNLYGLLLSKYCGRALLNWVLVNGETETGVTLHYTVKRADAGTIAAQQRVVISLDGVALALRRKLCQTARHLLEEALPAIKTGDYAELPQQEAEATCFSRRMPKDSFLDWNRPAAELHNQVRVVSDPWSGAFSYVGTQKFTVWSSRVCTNDIVAQPGTVIFVSPLLITCVGGVLEIIIGQAGDGIATQGLQLA